MDHLTTEARNPASTHLDELAPLEIARLMNREDRRAVEAVGAQAEALGRAIEVVAERLRTGGRLVYVGAGTSGRLGVLDAAECPPTFNTPPELVVGVIAGGHDALTRAVEGAEDNPEQGAADLEAIAFCSRDVLVGIATSGRTPYVIGACDYARQLGAAVIGLACNESSELAGHVDFMIAPVVGPEVLSGSTRLKAGTATKLVLNTLSTGAMVLLGKTFGNLMVDLRATNSKLRARTNRIVRTLTGLDETTADELLHECGGELKTALVARLTGVEVEVARARLAAAGGVVRRAIADGRAAAPSHDLTLGIDGGGTTTVALLADGDAVIGRGVGGPSNRHAVGDARALDSLDEAVAAAFVGAGLKRGPVRAACLGLAGSDRPEDKQFIRDWSARAGLAQWVEVTNDAAILLAAGTPDGWGVALVAGTGSIAVARGPDGRTCRAGGWGYLLGDEGSGYSLVRDALIAAAKAHDGRGPATALTGPLLRAMGLSEPMEFIPAIYAGRWDRAALSALAPVVLDAAQAGDAIGGEIVDRGVAELAGAVLAAWRSLAAGPAAPPLALSGGTLVGSSWYRGRVLERLAAAKFEIGPVEIVTEPATGAVRMARRHAAILV